MYLPGHFEETRIEVLHQLMRERPLATLVTLGAAGLSANHLPIEVDAAPAPNGTLRCHVARANPVWRDHSLRHRSVGDFSRGAGLHFAFLV